MDILVFYDLIRGPEIQIPNQFSGPMSLIGTAKPFHKQYILYRQ